MLTLLLRRYLAQVASMKVVKRAIGALSHTARILLETGFA